MSDKHSVFQQEFVAMLQRWAENGWINMDKAPKPNTLADEIEGVFRAEITRMTKAVERLAGWHPQTFENDGAAYNSGVNDTAAEFRRLASKALKGNRVW